MLTDLNNDELPDLILSVSRTYEDAICNIPARVYHGLKGVVDVWRRCMNRLVGSIEIL
ncbi:hypothetical protein [Halioglobus sp. HI00S01]|uniref:hypothetical protein n=1 Tax=Halioglobus sp. HI00S01 TaxID=1822214 RepID=UPI0012E7C797|nr:hypothetical protein [Halioglobus sp. HI00S01]